MPDHDETITNCPYLCAPNIMDTPDYTTKMIELDMTNKTVVKAGTPISADGKEANDETAIGILLNDCHACLGTHRGLVVIAGRVKQDVAADHSGIALSDAAKSALINVTFTGDGVRTGDLAVRTKNPVFTGSFSQNRKANTTIGDYSHAEGYATTASSDYSHAEGHNTTASGYGSHAEGHDTTASGYGSHAEGYDTTASGLRSHAEGHSTTASGAGSHTEGRNTTAESDNSHAEGLSTTARSNCQHVQGKHNIIDSASKYAHIVGNGLNSDSRSNAHTLDWSGNAWFAGAVEGTALILKSSTAGSTKRFKITVDDSGALSATEITE